MTTQIVYHDGRDWAIEKREGRYWCVPLNADQWQEGPPLGMTVQDLDMLFTEYGGSDRATPNNMQQ